jgi:hypothetical protein
LLAIAFTSLGPDELDEPEFPVFPLFPFGSKGNPPGFPLPTRWNDGAADGFELDHAAWPMPTPAARTASEAPPTSRPFRSLWSRFAPDPLGRGPDGQNGVRGSVGGPP